MTSFVSHTTIDCRDAYALSEWWKPVLGYVDIDGDPNEPGHEECMIRDPDSGHQVLFIEVPVAEGAELPGKRIHLDVVPRTGTRDEEVDRLLAHGATQVADHRGNHGPGTGWVTLADPEGNQLCVLRSEAERATP
ncbi:VOC family protein [Nocardioides dongxiaopingii]|uniref:VOC family protein n=1 Tax=Nocardioides sp. S-1144 TaxID=2582905 RepID=UPI00110E9428|nr:VOC family protein [Nocardioides sp. S-1144]QCW51428.1 VOC family protein [Nocardioides sp. S-1144]